MCTLNYEQNLILKDNKEILVPEKERIQMLGLAYAENHKGPEEMLHQLRGKVFWPWMSKQVEKMAEQQQYIPVSS